MEIKFYRKNVYGKELMYVADEKIAHHLSQLTGRKTVDSRDMHDLKELGFTFSEVLAPKAD